MFQVQLSLSMWCRIRINCVLPCSLWPHLSVGLRQLRESVTSPDEDANSGISSLPPQKDLEKHTVSVI